MFLTVHVLLGALIGLSFESWPLVFLLAFVSHFILDMIPHWDGPFDNELFKKNFVVKIRSDFALSVIFDLVVALFVTFLLFKGFNSGLVVVGAIASMLPDALKLGYLTPLRKIKWYKKHLLFHAHIQRDVRWRTGLLTQFIAVVIFLKLLFF